MRLPIERKPVKVYPDMKRVIARFFFNGDERARDVIGRVMGLSEAVGPLAWFRDRLCPRSL
jgi:hypothetical protein